MRGRIGSVGSAVASIVAPVPSSPLWDVGTIITRWHFETLPRRRRTHKLLISHYMTHNYSNVTCHTIKRLIIYIFIDVFKLSSGHNVKYREISRLEHEQRVPTAKRNLPNWPGRVSL